MPAEFYVVPELRMVFSKAVGTLGVEAVVDHMDRLLADPSFQPEFNQLLDFTEVTQLDLSHDQVRGLAVRQIFSKSSKRAFVVPSDLMFGMGRTFSAYRELAGDTGIRMFRDKSEALAWLGVEREPDPSVFQRLYQVI